MNVGNALKITCVGFAAGVVLRVIGMLYRFDYASGFSTDGGVMAGCCLALVLVTSLVGAVMCFLSRKYFGPYVPRKNNVLGVVAVLSGLALIISAAMQAVDYRSFRVTGYSVYESSERTFIHLAFLAACLLFGLVQLYVSTGFFLGKNSLQKMPLLYLTGVLWGIVYLILVYVFYAKSASFVENAFAVLGGAFTLLTLFYLCKLFSGIEEESAAKRVFVFGIAAVIFTITYSFSNLSLLALGKTYTGEIPPMFQLASLGVSIYLLVFLFTFRKYSLRRTPKGETGEFPLQKGVPVAGSASAEGGSAVQTTETQPTETQTAGAQTAGAQTAGAQTAGGKTGELPKISSLTGKFAKVFQSGKKEPETFVTELIPAGRVEPDDDGGEDEETPRGGSHFKSE